MMPKKDQLAECLDDAGLEVVRRIGREFLDEWERIAADDPDNMVWARHIVETLDAEDLQRLISELRRLARDSSLDPLDRAIARQRVNALVASQTKRTREPK